MSLHFGLSTPAQADSSNDFQLRMNRLKLQSPLATGLGLKKNPSNDYFYREIMVKNEPTNKITTDEELDVGSALDNINIQPISSNNKGISDKNSATDCATYIRYIIPVPTEENLSQNNKPIIDQIVDECEKYKGLIQSYAKLFVETIKDQRLVDITSLGMFGGDSFFYAQTMRNAARLRNQFNFPAIKNIDNIEHVHAFLLRSLPDDYLVSYLNLLRFLKLVDDSFFASLLNHSVDLEIQVVNELIREFVCTQLSDPNFPSGQKDDIKPLGKVTVILVYPQITTPSNTKVKHAHENLFGKLFPAAIHHIKKLDLNFDVDADAKTIARMCLARIRNCVNEVVKRHPDDHIFLAGWGVSSLLNMQAVQKVPGVTAVLNFATPMHSHFGLVSRGSIDDIICISYCPFLFVTGNLANNSSVSELLLLPDNMICETGLVVVGGADNELRVSSLTLSVERLTQKCVDRAIMEHVLDFMKLVMNECGFSARENRQFLVPVKRPDPFSVDLTTLKNRAVGALSARGESKRGKKIKKEDE